jgi:aspartate racemase
MGPEATILLQQRLMAAIPTARDDSDHIPLLIDMNPQVPSRIDRLIRGRGPDPAPVLAQMAMRLEAAGAAALAMPCNTAHHYATDICDAVKIPFINMVTLSAKTASQHSKDHEPVGILASPAVRKTGLLDRALETHDIKALWPEPDDNMLSAIQTIKEHGTTPEAKAILKAASQDLWDKGARVQLIACSEFSLISNSVASECKIIDTLDVLVGAIVKTSSAAQNL